VTAAQIVVDIGGEGFQFTSALDGVFFDLGGDDRLDHIAWTLPATDQAFLALDRNENGIIDHGTELFGNMTPQSGTGAKNGFLALAEYDKPENGGNGDGIIGPADTIFRSLTLWLD
jgi:hypothetical protein